MTKSLTKDVKSDSYTSKNKVLFGDGSHILYVNGKYRGNDEIIHGYEAGTRVTYEADENQPEG